MSSTPSSCSRDRSRNGSRARHERDAARRPSSGHRRRSPRAAGPARRAGCAGCASPRSRRQHALDHHRRLQQVAAVLREDLADARLADAGARPDRCAAARRDRRRRLDLDDEVDGAHVDPQLQAARGDERRQAPCLELLLDLEPLLARDAAVVRPHQLLAGQLVQARGQPLGQPPRVHEDQRGPMRPDELQQPRVDATARSSDVASGPAAGRRSTSSSMPGHVLDRHDHLEVELLARAGVHDLDLAVRSPPRKAAIASSGRCVADRPMRCGSASARWLRRSRLSARCAPRFVAAMACTSSTMTCSTPRRISRAWLVSSR